MDPISVLCLYSQYSENSDRFISKIQKNTIDFIQLVPVDTVYSRRIISGRVKSVPAIVIQYPNSVEIYEGVEAFDWLEEVILNKKDEEVKNSMKSQLLEIEAQKKLLETEKEKLQQFKDNKEENPIESEPKKNIEKVKEYKSEKSKDRYTAIEDIVAPPDQSVESESMVDSISGTKLSASSKKTQDLLSRARELEKGREDFSNKKPPFPVQ